MTAQRHLRQLPQETPASDRTRNALPEAPRPVPRPAVTATGAGRTNTAVHGGLLSPGGLYFVTLLAAVAFGVNLPTSDYLSPQSGTGYALGILGGSAMLLLLLYPLRKRLPSASFLGTTRFWFQCHMALGLLGPVLILFHANFSLGATNSNVALFCMLVVAGSGLFGRYFYGRIHHQLHGREATLDDLKAFSGRMRHMTSAVSFLPELARRIDDEQEVIERRCARAPLLLRPLFGITWAVGARRRLRRAVRDAVAAGADRRHDPRRESLQTTAYRYVDDRLGATRRVLEFRAFQKFFSLWHALHMPLFFMLIIAGVVHVVAVHVY